MNCRELSTLLRQDGWRLARIRGAHHHFTHPAKEGVLVIPEAEGEMLSPKALRSVLRRADRPPGLQSTPGVGFLVVIESTGSGFSAYAPDLVGCVSAGQSAEEAEASMREAIHGYVEELRNACLPIPAPSASVRLVNVNV